jgi:hypothetical protein
MRRKQRLKNNMPAVAHRPSETKAFLKNAFHGPDYCRNEMPAVAHRPSETKAFLKNAFHGPDYCRIWVPLSQSEKICIH